MVLSLIFYSIFTTHIDILDKINLFNYENKNNLNSERKEEEEESYLNMKKKNQISRPFPKFEIFYYLLKSEYLIFGYFVKIRF